MTTPGLPSPGGLNTIEDIRNYLFKYDRTMKYLLENGLNTKNINEIGGWEVSEDALMSVDKDVGFSTLDTADDDLRIWAGSATTGLAPFRVYESGFVFASNVDISGIIHALSGVIGGWTIGADSLMDSTTSVGMSSKVTGGDDIRFWAGNPVSDFASFRVYESGHAFMSNLTMVGGSIDWGAVLKPSYTPEEVGAIAANQDAVFDVLTNFGTSQGLFLDPSTGQLYINATYINTGIMTAIQYRTSRPGDGVPRIEIYQNQLSSYNDVNQKDGIQLGENIPDEIDFQHCMGNISFYSNGYRALAITDEVINGYSIGPRNGYAMAIGWSGDDYIYARGNWIFSGTTEGVTAEFA